MVAFFNKEFYYSDFERRIGGKVHKSPSLSSAGLFAKESTGTSAGSRGLVKF